MTTTVDLPSLLGAARAEVKRIVADLRSVEAALLPSVLDVPGMGRAMQSLDPVLQRLSALEMILDHASETVPPLALPSVGRALETIRLAQFMREIRPDCPIPAQENDALFHDGN